MITKNAKKLLAGLPCASISPSYFFIPIVDVTGATRYFGYTSNYFPFTVSVSTFTLSSSGGRGIKVGSGTTPATENDYNLESQITSGISGNISIISRSLDANGNPVTELLITVANTSSADITIGEIGHFEDVKGSTNTGAGAGSTYYILIDRVVLDTPITIPAGNSATITYSFKGVWNSQS